MSDVLALDVDRVADTLRVSLGVLVRRLRQVKRAGDLTLSEMRALSHLDREGPTTLGAFAKAERVSPQSIGATIAALEARGFVARASDASDGRRYVLSVTDDGRGFLRGERSARTQRLSDVLAAEFAPQERAQLLAIAPLLERLAAAL